MKPPKKYFFDIKTPKNHPKSNVTKPNFNHPWQVDHAKTSSKNPKTPLKNFKTTKKNTPMLTKTDFPLQVSQWSELGVFPVS